MLNNMAKEAQVGTGGQGKELYPGEIAIRARKLMDGFVKILQPRLDKMSAWDRLRTQAKRDAAIMAGNGVPPIAVFRRGLSTFELINYHVGNPEYETLAISTKSELAVLANEGPLGNGLIKYIVKGRSEAVNTGDAVRGVERMLRKLRYPLLPQILPIRIGKGT
jgi:hypothetical protein